jgi:transposase-like protein
MEVVGPDTLQQAILYFQDPTNCREYLVAHRWPDGVTCPRCGSESVIFQPKYNRWQCGKKHDRRQFTSKTGTIFEDSPIGLDKWLLAMWQIVNCKNGISSYELHRAIGVTQKSAWFLLHRIRLALQGGSLEKQFSGDVEADETFVGGKIRNMNLKAKGRHILKYGNVTSGVAGKAIVMGLLERHGAKNEASQARVQVLAKRKRGHLMPVVEHHVEKGANVYTDELKSYRELLVDYTHEVIDHTEAYVRDKVVHTNGMENFWSLFKRALKGTYVSVEPFHLQAYADEQCYRFNNRKMTDGERFDSAVKCIVGKRITFDELTGKADPQA